MKWEIPHLHGAWHHLPHALTDLLHKEDEALVKAGAPGLTVRRQQAAPRIAIEKDIDPAISRSEQNMALLIHDYLETLPQFSASDQHSEALLEHWRKIILEQPQRLAEAHLDSWHNERSRAFWKEKLKHYDTSFGIHADAFPLAMDDWERSAGAGIIPLKTLASLKTKQWQDLVIRERLHKLDLLNMSR
ncbi:MAG: hypothetical protein K2Q01_00240 [Rickettsiales bacterium]|nr:hypothetical protein [Rickettsiales bacterium]